MFHEEPMRKVRRQNEQYRAFSSSESSPPAAVKSCDLTCKQILRVLCPTYGATTGERCELHTGDLERHPQPA
jgi:hypothetical protein